MGTYMNYTITIITDNSDINKFNIYTRPIANDSLQDLVKSFSLFKPRENSENITIYEWSNTDYNGHDLHVYKNGELVLELGIDCTYNLKGEFLSKISNDIFIKYNDDSRTFEKHILGKVYNDYG